MRGTNGWADPQSDSDFAEAHPYLFIRAWSGKEPFRLKDMAGVSGAPHLRQEQKESEVPIVINEYDWLWLNRDGTPTTLTKKIYEGFFPEGSACAWIHVSGAWIAWFKFQISN